FAARLRRAMQERVARNSTVAIGVLAALSTTVPARAVETEVDATVDAQFYALTGPFGGPELSRRRYTQTLALSVYDIQGERVPFGPLLSFKSRVRLDADFGQSNAERDPKSPYFIPGLEQAPLDVMYAYLDGERYFNGYLGFRLGRQYVVDALGWWSFD